MLKKTSLLFCSATILACTIFATDKPQLSLDKDDKIIVQVEAVAYPLATYLQNNDEQINLAAYTEQVIDSFIDFIATSDPCVEIEIYLEVPKSLLKTYQDSFCGTSVKIIPEATSTVHETLKSIPEATATETKSNSSNAPKVIKRSVEYDTAYENLYTGYRELVDTKINDYVHSNITRGIKKNSNGIFSFKCRTSNNGIRLYFKVENNTLYLLECGDKSSGHQQSTDIKNAEKIFNQIKEEENRNKKKKK